MPNKFAYVSWNKPEQCYKIRITKKTDFSDYDLVDDSNYYLSGDASDDKPQFVSEAIISRCMELQRLGYQITFIW